MIGVNNPGDRASINMFHRTADRSSTRKFNLIKFLAIGGCVHGHLGNTVAGLDHHELILIKVLTVEQRYRFQYSVLWLWNEGFP